MQSQRGQLTTVQIILKGKLSEIVTQYNEILDAFKKVDQFITEAETRVITTVTQKLTSYSLNLASHFDLMQDKLNICLESMEEMVHFDYSDNNETGKSKKSSITQESSSLVSDIFKRRLETLEEKMSSLETHVLAQENNLSSRLNNTEAKQILMEKILVRNDDVAIQGKADLSKIRQDVDRLTSRHEVCRHDLEEFQKKMEALERLRDALNEVNKNVSSRLEMSQKLKELEGGITQVKSTVAKLDSLITKQDSKEAAVEMPAFVAEAVGKTKGTVRNVIKFSGIVYNKMGCYDTTTGIFKAPSKGLYFFSTSLSTNSKGSLTVTIRHNGRGVASCGTPDGMDFQTSTSVLLELSPGDLVWLETDSQTSVRGVDIGSGFSNFLGLQLR